MKKSVIAFLVIIIAVVFLYEAGHRHTGKTVGLSPTSTASPIAPGSQAPATSTPAHYQDGTYTGDVVSTFYGDVQVAAVVSGSKITGINLLQLPNDRPHSAELSQYAGPQLKSESLQAQSAQVDIISGATTTSAAFIQSLQSALTKAGSSTPASSSST